MGDLTEIRASEDSRWRAVLDQVARYDFYHLPSYHLLAQRNGEGAGVLVVYRESDAIMAWPLLTRSIEIDKAKPLRDATSVYGYAGPLYSAEAHHLPDFFTRATAALKRWAEEAGVISIFTRFHPIFQNHAPVRGFGEVLPLGKTVSIDLRRSPKEQWSEYRGNHRRQISKARREGLTVVRDETWEHFAAFFDIYIQTMQDVDAEDYYFFDKGYFYALREALGDSLALFVAKKGDQLCAAGLFVHTQNIIQYHLSGTDRQFNEWAPFKLILDEVRLWGNDVGADFLHLGGGVGANEDDGLFRFKAGFSSLHHQFAVGHHIVKPRMYTELVQLHFEQCEADGKQSDKSFFPAYRAPLKSKEL